MTAVLFLLRAVILVLLWGFVVAAIVTVRHDIFGTRRTATQPAARPPKTAPAPPVARAPAPATARRRDKTVPRRLVVVEGALAGQSFPLAGATLTIGRADDSTIVLSDDYVSTHHARLVPDGERWLVEDLGSTNGTYLDRQRVTEPTPVPPGVPIRVGKTVLELRK
jgi:pSer/pThr/pTyr-binding forkhead associated (FHA) protein